MKIARLRFRINITILFTIIGLSSIFGILRIQSELQRYASSRNRIQLLLDSIITLNRQGIVDILIKNNNMNDSLETIAEIENIYNVSLYDSKGKILFFSGEKLDDGASIRVSVLSEEDKKENFTDFISPLEQTTVIKDSVFIREQIHIVKYKTSLPLGSYLGAINLENRDIGYIRIFFNLSSIEEEIYYSIISFFILVMTILLIFLGIMNFLLVRYYEDSIEGNFHLSNNGKLVKANRSFLKMFGYRSIKNINKRINKDFDKLFADPLEFIDVMSKIKNSNSTKFENNYLRKDKTNIWLLIEINKITDIQGQTSYFECSALDITERKEKEKAERDLLKNISETKEYLNNIFNSLPSMVISIDTDKNILQWNDTIVHTLEIPAKEVLGKKLSKIIPFFKEYEIKIGEAIDKSIKTDFKCDQEINHKTLILHITISPLCKNDIVQGAIISMDDITEEQKKDRQLLQIQKMETVGSLAGGLAHDFNNILGGITATLSIIKHRINRNGEIAIDKLMDYINTIDNASNRAIEMVGQLLSLSRKKEVEHKLVDLNIILNNITKLVVNSFDNSIKLISFPYKGSALVNADMAQIEQVLLNLCVNANHAMTIMRKEEEKKGGELTLSIEWIKVDNSFFQIHTDIDNNNSEFWCLSIQDTGIGMDKKTISKIFDPFYTTKKEGEGTGLGLSMVYNIMVQHNGAITVYSELDIGTRFCLFFPVISSDTEKKKNEDGVLKLGKKSGLILVVDDDDIMLTSAEFILNECGYTVITADNGYLAMEIFNSKKNEISLVLTDFNMPSKNGSEVLKEMIAIKPDAKIIISSGISNKSRIESILNNGAKGFIQKPYKMDRLIKLVDDVIQLI